VQVKALWRATLITSFSWLLLLYCRFSILLGRYRREQYP